MLDALQAAGFGDALAEPATAAMPRVESDRTPMLAAIRRAMLLVNIDPPECVTHSGGFPGSSNDTTGGSNVRQAGLRPCAPGNLLGRPQPPGLRVHHLHT